MVNKKIIMLILLGGLTNCSTTKKKVRFSHASIVMKLSQLQIEVAELQSQFAILENSPRECECFTGEVQAK